MANSCWWWNLIDREYKSSNVSLSPLDGRLSENRSSSCRTTSVQFPQVRADARRRPVETYKKNFKPVCVFLNLVNGRIRFHGAFLFLQNIDELVVDLLQPLSLQFEPSTRAATPSHVELAITCKDAMKPDDVCNEECDQYYDKKDDTTW